MNQTNQTDKRRCNKKVLGAIIFVTLLFLLKASGGFLDRIHVKPSIDSTITEDATRKNITLTEQLLQDTRNKQQDKFYRVAPDKQGLHEESMPAYDALYDLALAEARSGKYAYLYGRGYTEDEIAQMVMDKYCKPALFEAAGELVSHKTKMTADRWNNFEQLLMKRKENEYRLHTPRGQMGLPMKGDDLKNYNDYKDSLHKAMEVIRSTSH